MFQHHSLFSETLPELKIIAVQKKIFLIKCAMPMDTRGYYITCQTRTHTYP